MLKKLGFGVLVLATLIGVIPGTLDAERVTNYDNLLAAGEINTYLVMKDGASFYSTGAGSVLGVPGINRKTSPVQVEVSDIEMIDSGSGNHAVLVKKDGTVWSWGIASYGEIGTGKQKNIVKEPTKNNFIDNVKEARAGDGFTIALKKDGTVWSYGKNLNGQLGIGNKGNSTFSVKPVQVQNLKDIVSIDTDDSSCAALDKNNTLWVWGKGSYGSLGQGNKEDQVIPVEYPIHDVKNFTVGFDHIYVVTNNGEVFGSGSNDWSRLGDGTTIKRTSPVSIDITNVDRLSAGRTHTLALKKDGSLWAWGVNSRGTVGNGTDVFSIKTPVQVIDTSFSPLSNIVAIYAADHHSLALKSDGSLWSWGHNTSGQLGIGNAKDQYFATKSSFPNPFE